MTSVPPGLRKKDGIVHPSIKSFIGQLEECKHKLKQAHFEKAHMSINWHNDWVAC